MTVGQLWSIFRGRQTNFSWMNASWTYYPNGDPMSNVQQSVVISDETVKLRAAAELALKEMCNTVAPRDSFTDAVDALDAALHPQN